MIVGDRQRALLEGARLGDPAAIDDLLKLCQPDIRRYAYRHCLASDIDDAVQETLLVLARKLRSLRAVSAFSGWLLQIVRRECRRLERRLFHLDPYDEERMAHWLAVATDQTVRLDLARALETLPEHYREIVVLRDFHELTLREIAARTGLTVAATKARLHRARAMVREYLLT